MRPIRNIVLKRFLTLTATCFALGCAHSLPAAPEAGTPIKVAKSLGDIRTQTIPAPGNGFWQGDSRSWLKACWKGENPPLFGTNEGGDSYYFACVDRERVWVVSEPFRPDFSGPGRREALADRAGPPIRGFKTKVKTNKKGETIYKTRPIY